MTRDIKTPNLGGIAKNEEEEEGKEGLFERKK
jgi:hypothetical protein